jgi:hypothetical protein
VFAALAVSRLIEDRTGWSIRKFVRTARRYRTVHIRAGQQLLTAEDLLPDDLREALALIARPERAHYSKRPIIVITSLVGGGSGSSGRGVGGGAAAATD